MYFLIHKPCTPHTPIQQLPMYTSLETNPEPLSDPLAFLYTYTSCTPAQVSRKYSLYTLFTCTTCTHVHLHWDKSRTTASPPCIPIHIYFLYTCKHVQEVLLLHLVHKYNMYPCTLAWRPIQTHCHPTLYSLPWPPTWGTSSHWPITIEDWLLANHDRPLTNDG